METVERPKLHREPLHFEAVHLSAAKLQMSAACRHPERSRGSQGQTLTVGPTGFLTALGYAQNDYRLFNELPTQSLATRESANQKDRFVDLRSAQYFPGYLVPGNARYR